MKKLALAVLLGGVVGCSPIITAPEKNAEVDPAQTQQQTGQSAQIIGAKFIEEVKGKPDETIIPYKKYQLDNGLTVIIHEDHSDPLVHLDVTYHVGSGREELGKSGFAHFFEHMMFQGSEHVADEEHFKILTEAGGNLNGTTNNDRTNYFETAPSNYLETMLWLEADRMGFLLDAVTQSKFEVQRETVKNERGQRIDNRPYGRVNERVGQAMFPQGHPYSWPVIGYMDDLNRVNVNDLKKFFLRWYGPNNATVTVGGNITAEQALPLIVKYFGPIPRGPAVDIPEKNPLTLTEDRYISMEDNVHLPLLYLSFPTVTARHDDEAPLDILSEILGGGKTSLLYKNLVKNQLAVQAQVTHPCRELACSLNLVALPHPASGKSLADLEKIIRDSFDEFEKRGVEEDDLIKVKATMEANFVFGLQSVEGKVSTLAANQTFTGNPNYIGDDIARYNNVTKADVERVFKKYIKGRHAVIMSVVPKGKLDMIARADTFTPVVQKFDAVSATTEADLKLRRATDTFDRSQKPAIGKTASVEVPEFWRQSLDNGIRVLGSVSDETPTTTLLLKVPAGHYYEMPDKAGTAELVGGMLSEATLKRSGEQMSQELRKLGARVDIDADNHYLNISVNSLSKNLAQTLVLVQEKILQPAFNETDFNRLKGQLLESIQNSKKDADYLARRAFNQLMFGQNIASMPSEGSFETVKSLTLAEVKAFYETHFKPSSAQMIVVSNLSQKELAKDLQGFNQWQGKATELTLQLPMPLKKPTTIYLVNKDKAAQSAIRIGKRGLKQDITGEFYTAQLMNFVLGGNFNSRINLNLREDKGYTYGARTGFWGDKFAGGFTASASVRADATDKSIVEFVKEIQSYQQAGISSDELTFTKSAINQQDALKYETPAAKLNFLAQILEHDLEPSFVDERTKILNALTVEQVNALAKKHLNLDEMLMVVVGDAEILKPKLMELGYKVEDYNM